jgi:hypothetical protein
MKGSCVMMPREQNSLEQDREYADERTASAPPLSSASEPNPYREAHPHLDLSTPAYISRARRSERVRATV